MAIRLGIRSIDTASRKPTRKLAGQEDILANDRLQEPLANAPSARSWPGRARLSALNPTYHSNLTVQFTRRPPPGHHDPLEPFVDDRFQASIPIRVGRVVTTKGLFGTRAPLAQLRISEDGNRWSKSIG
jgi:hypothetical protein